MTFDLKTYVRSTVRVSDGACGTQLQKLGLPVGKPPEWMNVHQPAAVEQVAASYIQAGSDVVLANSMSANRFAMHEYGMVDEALAFAEAAARIARRAADAAKREVRVFGSIGPTGKIIMMGDVNVEDLTAAFAQQAEALEFGGVDAIVLETFNEIDELRLALAAVKKATSLPVVASMTFAAGPDKTMTMMGNSPADLVKLARSEGADAVGANCGVGPDNYVRVAQLLREAGDLPIWIKANAGLPTTDGKGQTRFPMAPASFASFVPALVQAGANFIGGCCGTTPGHIEAVRAAVDKLRDSGLGARDSG